MCRILAADTVPCRSVLKSWNLANALVVLGLIALGVSAYLPIASAERVARVESRARVVCDALLVAALEEPPILPGDDLATLTERVRATCSELGIPESDLPTLDESGPFPVYRTKHYVFRVVDAPRDPVRAGHAARRPIEVYGWPDTLLPPGRSAFFVPEAGWSAYSRNLSAKYKGFDPAPLGGVGAPRSRTGSNAPASDYRARNNERWLLLPDGRTEAFAVRVGGALLEAANALPEATREELAAETARRMNEAPDRASMVIDSESSDRLRVGRFLLEVLDEPTAVAIWPMYATEEPGRAFVLRAADVRITHPNRDGRYTGRDVEIPSLRGLVAPQQVEMAPEHYRGSDGSLWFALF